VRADPRGAVSTTVSILTRSISVLLESGDTERFALVRLPNGDVHWRHDLFGVFDEATGGRPWIAHRGQLTVGEVAAQVPHCERHVVAWTRDEIDCGPDDADGDIFVRDVRRRALAALEAQLAELNVAQQS
jgi:hypothetical protein